MKKILFSAMVTIAVLTTYAQKTEWKQMNDFHSVMSVTFHPAEENNLQPTKDSADILLAKAKAWQTSKVPAGYNGTVTKPIIKRLVAECTAIQAAVKLKKPDADLKSMISKAHDTFHEIMEKCRKEEHH